MLQSRNKEGNNIFAPRIDNIMSRGSETKSAKRVSDFVPSSMLGWKGRIAKRIAPQYLDDRIRDEMGPGIATVADGVIQYNNAKEASAANTRNYFKENSRNLNRSLDTVIARQSQGYVYGGKRKIKKSKKSKKSKRKSKKSKRII